MSGRKQRKDAVLWDAYEQAVVHGDVDRQRKLAGAILECHRGFLIQYSVDTAFRQWTQETREDYRAALTETVLGLVPSYDPSKASFLTFVKPYLRDVKWKVHIEAQSASVGIETARMRAAVDELRADHAREGLPEPTTDEVAGFLTARFSKSARPVGPQQADRLMAPERFEHLDAPVSSSDGGQISGWDLLPGGADIEADFVAREEARSLIDRVHDALQGADLDDLERTVVAERLMAPPRRVVAGEVIHPGPATFAAIGRRFAVAPEEVSAVETDLKARLADLLA